MYFIRLMRSATRLMANKGAALIGPDLVRFSSEVLCNDVTSYPGLK